MKLAKIKKIRLPVSGIQYRTGWL